MANAWDHLPNAKHIDRIRQSLKDDPRTWDAAGDAVWDSAGDAASDAAGDTARYAGRDAARAAARNAARNAAWNAARASARNAARNAAWNVAWDAVMALIAWDDCAYLLDTDPDKVRVLALLGQPAAILLLPAAMVFQKEAV